jgi:hypothetical protein
MVCRRINSVDWWKELAMNDMKRLAAYLPDPIYEELEQWAEQEKRSLSNLVGYLLEDAVRERQKQTKTSEQGK